MAKKIEDKRRLFVKDPDVANRFDEVFKSGELDNRPKKVLARRSSSHYEFFDTHKERMKALIERELSYAEIADLLRNKIDKVRFEKLHASTVRTWALSQSDLSEIIKRQIAAGSRIARPNAGRRGASKPQALKADGIAVVQVPAPSAPAPAIAPSAPAPTTVSMKTFTRHMHGLKVMVFDNLSNAVMATEDYLSPIPGKAPMIVAGQMLLAEPSRKFSELKISKHFGLEEWGETGALMDCAISYWRDFTLDDRQRHEITHPGGEASFIPDSLMVKAYVGDQRRLEEAALNMARYGGAEGMAGGVLSGAKPA